MLSDFLGRIRIAGILVGFWELLDILGCHDVSVGGCRAYLLLTQDFR